MPVRPRPQVQHASSSCSLIQPVLEGDLQTATLKVEERGLRGTAGSVLDLLALLQLAVDVAHQLVESIGVGCLEDQRIALEPITDRVADERLALAEGGGAAELRLAVLGVGGVESGVVGVLDERREVPVADFQNLRHPRRLSAGSEAATTPLGTELLVDLRDLAVDPRLDQL